MGSIAYENILLLNMSLQKCKRVFVSSIKKKWHRTRKQTASIF